MEETCGNINTLKDFNIRSLCDTCEHSIGGCGYALASDLIHEFKVPGLRQEHIIVECQWYERERLKTLTLDQLGREVPNNFPVVGSLRPLLFKVGIQDLCANCPPEVKSGCKRHRQLNDLAHTSLKARSWVQAQVVCCNQSERFYQISEPQK